MATGAATSHNSSNNGAHSFDMAQLKLGEKIVVFAPLLLPRFGLRLQPQKIDLWIAASAASFLSGKSNGVVAANVMRHWLAAS